MGLLSNPKQREKIIKAVAQHNNKLCILCYLVGLAWFLALAYEPLNARTYFSENALLPGVVDNDFRFNLDLSSTLTELKTELKKDKKKFPREWVYKKFQDIGLDTYIHNYSIQYPINIVKEGQLIPGQNVYGILRARRAASTECIIISTPMRPKSSDLPATTGSLILMLGLADYFRRQPYWSKDIIFLATDHEQIGMQAWLNGYHQVNDPYIQSDPLPGHGGQIQAALNLEIASNSIKYFNVKIEGVNGQLPNLDLINLVVRLCRKEHVEVTLYDKPDIYQTETPEGYLYTLTTMMKMMWAQASGLPSGNHGLFHRYHIEALTLEGVHKKKSGRVDLQTAGRVVEGITRSLNNLLERFHQSFFFYVLAGTNRYISIGLYMPPFGIICAAGLIKAIAVWVALYNDPNEETKEQEGKGKSKGDKPKQEKISREELSNLVQEEAEEDLDDTPNGLMSILPLLFSAVLMAVLCHNGPGMVASMAGPFKMNVEDGIFFAFLALFTASLLFPRMVARKTTDDKCLVFDWRLMKAITLIYQALFLFSLALMNISLAFFMAVVMVPVNIIVHPSNSRINKWSQRLMLLLVSPLSMLYAAALVSHLDDKVDSVWSLLVDSWTTMSRGLLLTIVDRYFFSSWFCTLFSFTIFPHWLLLWGISFCEVVGP